MTIVNNNFNSLKTYSESLSCNKKRTLSPNHKQDVSFKSKLVPVKKLGNFFDLTRNVNGINDTAGLIACITSVIGFGIGGPALIYDHNYKKQHHKEDDKKNGYGHFHTETKIGKVGLFLNQAALTISGFAGAMTGFSMGVPLMAAGEFIGNIFAAPVINTPIGYGLLNIGLAAIFGGRAFDKNPAHKAKMALLMSKKGFVEKAKYVLGNMGTHIKGAAQLSIELAKHIAGLFSLDTVKRQNAKNFLNSKIFRVKSSTLTFVQNINAKGVVTEAKPGLKGNSNVLLVASSLLALTGVFMIATEILKKVGIIKTDKVTKAGFVAGKVGQVFDNAGIMMYGLERCYGGNVTAGIPTVVSGATMMAGAPNADNDFGKGLTWFGLAAFFLFLSAERLQDANKVFKRLGKTREYKALQAKLESAVKGSKEYNEIKQKLHTLMQDETFNEASVFARQIEIDLSKILKGNKNQRLDNLRNMLKDTTEDSWVTLRKVINKNYTSKKERDLDKLEESAIEALKSDEDGLVRLIPQFKKDVQEELSKQAYNPNYTADDLRRFIVNVKKYPKEFAESIVSHERHYEEAIREAIYSNIVKSGKNYAGELETLISSSNPAVSKVAKACKTDYAELLKVE